MSHARIGSRSAPTGVAGFVALVLLAGCVSPHPGRRCCPRPAVPVRQAVVVRPEARLPVEAKPDPAVNAQAVWRYLVARYDADGNGVIERVEYTRANWFRLDQDENGVLNEADFQAGYQMRALAPVRRRLLQTESLARFLQADEQPARVFRHELEDALVAYDTSGDGALDSQEFDAASEARAAFGPEPDFFVQWVTGGGEPWPALLTADADADGTLSLVELLALFDTLEADDLVPPRAADGILHLRDTEPATVGELAPDFTLEVPGQAFAGERVTLSELRGQKPVALIFGSYT